MQSLSKIGLTLLTILFFTGCSSHLSSAYINNSRLARAYSVDPFDNLVIRGEGDIILTSTQPDYTVSAQSNSFIALSQLVFSQRQRTLYLQVPYETSVTINTPNLQRLTYIGSGDLMAKQLMSTHLDAKLNNNSNIELTGSQLTLVSLQKTGNGSLSINHIKTNNNLSLANQGDGNINLSGIINLSQLNCSGSGLVNILWINSPSLTIKAGNQAKLFLAGIAKHLYVDLTNFAYLDAKYLRVEDAFVHTANHSRAEVAVRDSLHGFAADSSNIYYHRLPKLISRYSWGSVLDMVGLDPAVPCDWQRF